jgi:hypothetical protein
LKTEIISRELNKPTAEMIIGVLNCRNCCAKIGFIDYRLILYAFFFQALKPNEVLLSFQNFFDAIIVIVFDPVKLQQWITGK